MLWANAKSVSRARFALKGWQKSRVHLPAFLPSLTLYSAVQRPL